MPFCQILNDTSLHYITNTVRGDISDLDPHKPVILLFPNNFTDVTWLREQFQYARLSEQYNLIGIDLRHMGRSKSPFNPKLDAWVDAADVAVVHEVLQLPPCHLFASGTGSCSVAMCLAILFPEKCLSLFLCSFPMQREDTPDWVLQDQQDLLELWCFPRNLEDFHLACEILLGYFLNNQATIELQNELIAWWQKNYSPTTRSSACFSTLRGITKPQYSEKELQAIRVPTFVMQGDKSLVKTPEYIQSLCEKLPSSGFLVVQGGPDCLPIVPEYASVVNRVFVNFLKSQPHVPARRDSPPDLEGVCRTALARLATFADDSDIAQRDPTTTFSFSRASQEDINGATELFNRCSWGENDAVNALDERGEPTLRFSKNFKEEKDVEYIRKVKTPPMAAEAEIVLVESCTIFETET